MGKLKASTKVNDAVKRDESPGWEAVLTDVTAEIQRTEQRLDDLKQSARILQVKIDSGEVFPFPETLAHASTQN